MILLHTHVAADVLRPDPPHRTFSFAHERLTVPWFTVVEGETGTRLGTIVITFVCAGGDIARVRASTKCEKPPASRETLLLPMKSSGVRQCNFPSVIRVTREGCTKRSILAGSTIGVACFFIDS